MSDPRPDSTLPRVLVMGVGNPLMGDEGVGPRVVEFLRSRWTFPSNVEVVDAGTMGFTILNMLQDVDFLVVVDAIDGTGHEPGTVLSLSAEDMAPNQVMHSLHDARLTDVLDAARLMGLEPEVTCVAVQIAGIEHWELELTPVVEAAVEPAANAVVDILATRGIELAAHQGPRDEGASILEALRTKDAMPGAGSP
jgi:hydrogenase maturation protease